LVYRPSPTGNLKDLGISTELAVKAASGVDIVSRLLNELAHELGVETFHIGILDDVYECVVGIGLEILNVKVCVDQRPSPVCLSSDCK